jgi:hypothetical protein
MFMFFKQYAAALIGTIFGAVVATLTTIMIYGDLPGHDFEALQQCLIEMSAAKR